MTLYQNKYRIESTRLRHWDYRSRGWYFVTICCANRRSLFGDIVSGEVKLSAMGRIAESGLCTLHQHYANVEVDEHVVMPNHVHAIISIEGEHCFRPDRISVAQEKRSIPFESPPAGSLSVIVRAYKAGVPRRFRDGGLGSAIWKPRFHDHLLRGDKVISAVRDYIRSNPANWKQDNEFVET